MPRTGEIGETIYADVEKLVADGMNRTQAFAKISEESGRQAGTVAANYYRVARKRAGGSLRATKPTVQARAKAAAPAKAAPKAKRTPRRRAATTSAADVSALTADLVRSIESLAAAINDQDRELRELRSRLDGARTLLG